jgi:putative nucleotidyltransferase with HDIG domain
MNIKDDFILKNINEGYLVGGSVRDFLMGKIFTDRDIAIKGAKTFAEKLAKQFDGTLVVLDNENQIYRVVLPDKINYLDISEIVGNSIEEDLTRRDFTINSIAFDLKEGKYIDTTGGREDLKDGILRQYKDSNFEDYPLRILRAFRFLSVTGFKPADVLTKAIKKYKPLLLKPSVERISYELMKLFGGEYCADTLLLMDEYGILEGLCPFVKEMKQVPPNSHHHLDLFHHVIETVRNIEELYKNGSEEIKTHLDKTDFGGFPRINHLKLAGFLHDIGKYSTWTVEEDTGRHRFIKHDDVGSKMCVKYLKDLKFSKKQIEYISAMVKTHIYPSNVIAAPDLSEKVMMRYLRKMEDNVIDNIILAKADRLSARGEDITEDMIKSNMEGLDKLLNFYLEKKDTMQPLPKLLDGNEIMKMLNIKPSHELGEILNALHEEQLNGNINSKQEAESFVKSIKKDS